MSFPFQNCYNCGGTICGSDNYLQDNGRFFCSAVCADEFHSWEEDAMEENIDEEIEQFLDAQDDFNDQEAYRDAGWGTDEDYGGYDHRDIDGWETDPIYDNDIDFGMHDN